MGCRKNFFKELSEIYLSWYNLLLQFLYYGRRNNRLKTAAPMLTCGVFMWV